VLGEELLINLPELPNANYRLGDNPAIAARAMQVVQLTETTSAIGSVSSTADRTRSRS
jgi:hypothetical protein